jgi:DNA polymerase-3 subunit beta
MRFTISQEVMSGIVSRAQSVIERKSTRPILENILLSCKNGKLTLSATDLRISMIQSVDCAVDEEGAVSITGKKIHEIVKEMEPGEIIIENRENEWVTITGGKSTFHLPGVSEEEFPTIPEAPETFLEMSSDVFGQMVSRTLFAASNDETRIYLCGVFLKEWTNDKGDAFLKMVATDGHRLSLVDRALEKPLNLFTEGIIIPKKGVSGW